jgi:O-antigen ligase
LKSPRAARSSPTRTTSDSQTLSDRATSTAIVRFIAGAGIVLLPLIISGQMREGFRFPKELLFRGLAMLFAAAAVIAVTFGTRVNVGRTTKLVLYYTAATCLWSGIAAAAGTHPAVSLATLLWILCAATLFITTYLFGHYFSVWFLQLALIPATINATLYWVQEARIWNPFIPEGYVGPRHLLSTALLGNPNDVGIYLLFPALIAAASALTTRSRARWFYAVIAMYLAGVIVSTRTMTAIIAYVAAIVVLSMIISIRSALITILTVAVLASVVFISSEPLRVRIGDLATKASAGDLNAVLTQRLPAFVAAYQMMRDDPVTGVGPGGFATNYMSYCLKLEVTYPSLLRSSRVAQGEAQNFGEVHNDHLQILAEGGIPAYVLFVAGLAGVASLSLRRRHNGAAVIQTARQRYSAVLAAPAATALAVGAVAQFPLELAAPLHIIVTIFALVLRWSEPDAA